MKRWLCYLADGGVIEARASAAVGAMMAILTMIDDEAAIIKVVECRSAASYPGEASDLWSRLEVV